MKIPAQRFFRIGRHIRICGKHVDVSHRKLFNFSNIFTPAGVELSFAYQFIFLDSSIPNQFSGRLIKISELL